jgi:DNA modification methylase
VSHLLIKADARRIPLADKSVQCVVTSPPYFGLRDYGVAGQLGLEPTPAEYVAGMVTVFREVRRVLRDDGTCWLNIGDSYTSGNRDGHGVVSSGKQISNGGTVGEQSAKRSPTPDGLKPKDLIGIPWMVAFALRDDGWYLRSDIIWSKKNPMPESVTDRPTKSHEYLFLLTKSARYHYDAEAIREHQVGPIQSRAIGNRGEAGVNHHGQSGRVVTDTGSRNKRSVWEIATTPFPGAHFATMPPKLVEPCILAGCPVGGVVFDPFNGAGTTGSVATFHGRRYVGADLNPAYLAMSGVRITKNLRPKSKLDPVAVAPLAGQGSFFA